MSESRISRRDFMRTSAGAAGATWAGKSFLLEPAPLPASFQSLPPSERVRFGIIGVGMRGSGLLRTSIQLPGVECGGACDLYDGRIELAKEILAKPAIPTTRRYQDLLEDKSLDCIVAAVPDHWHKRIVVDCCDAGKDVYCEKPMTHQVSEGFEMIAAAEKNRRIVQVGSQRASSLVYAKAQEMLAAGAVGELCLVEAELGRNDPCGAWQYTVPPDLSPQTLDWETWLGSAPRRPFDKLRWTRWRCYQDYGEGIPGDLFVHMLTGIHFVAGINAPPARAFSSGGLFRWKDGREVPDLIATLYEYPGVRVTLSVTLDTDTEEHTRLMGTKGIVDIHAGWVSLSPQQGEAYGPCTPGWPKKMANDYAAEWHKAHDPKPGTQTLLDTTTFYVPPGYNDTREHLWNFFQSVRTRRPAVEDAAFGNHTAIGCHLANYSYFHKTVAEWDAAARAITG
jgi:predicted dehydrogenase